jgi:hypothetical protein
MEKFTEPPHNLSDVSKKSHKGITKPVDIQKLESIETTRTEVPNIKDKKLMQKIDLYVLPILTLLYLLSFIDRANIVSVDANSLIRYCS